jgi:hypothetical protein
MPKPPIRLRRSAEKAKEQALRLKSLEPQHKLPAHWPRFTTEVYYEWMMARMPQGAVPADWSKHQPHNSYSPIFWYEDKLQRCVGCSVSFVFTKEEQRVWYEDYRVPIYASANRCRSCRAQRRLEQEQQKQHMAEVAAKPRHPNEEFFRRKGRARSRSA